MIASFPRLIAVTSTVRSGSPNLPVMYLLFFMLQGTPREGDFYILAWQKSVMGNTELHTI